MKILITGGTGFLGTRLALKLKEGNEVHIFSRDNQNSFADPAVKIKMGNLLSEQDVDGAFEGENYNVVYHLAANLDESDPNMYYENIDGTRNLIRACKKYGVNKIIYMSSCGVTGYGILSREDSPYRPNTLYEKSKAESEKIVVQSGMDYVVIRAPIIIGPNRIWEKISDAARKGYPVIGDGKNMFHLAQVDDVVELLALVNGNEKANRQIFNVATKDARTYQEVYDIMCSELAVPNVKKHIPVFIAMLMAFFHELSCKIRGKKPKLTMMASSIKRLVVERNVSIEKTRQVLGFEPKHSAETALRETIRELERLNSGKGN